MTAKDSSVEKYILDCIIELKNKANYNSHRINTFFAYSRKDNSIFGVLSALFIFNKYQNLLEKQEKTYLYDLKNLVYMLAQQYKNKDGGPSFNFYPTQPSEHFGGGYFMKHLDHFRLPDDIDDTFLYYSIYGTQPSQKQILLEQLLPRLQSDKGIDTWFGKKMPADHDVCAQSNFLHWAYSEQLGELELVKATEQHLLKEISNIKDNPKKIARHYIQTEIILYHYCRLLFEHPNCFLKYEKEKLINLIPLELNEMDSSSQNLYMICSALLGKSDFPNSLLAWDKFYFYVGAPLAPFMGANRLSTSSLFLLKWKNICIENALSAEYLLLVRNYRKFN
jgi:hypothetical protein